jgi:hypothetical protein
MFSIKRRNKTPQPDGIVTSDMARNDKDKLSDGLVPLAPKKNLMDFFRTLPGKIVAAVAVIVIVGIGLWVYAQMAKTDPAAPTTVCKQDILTEASKAINSADPNALNTVAEKIKQLPDYNRDMNCDYVLVQHSLMNGDTSAARDNLKALKDFFTGSYSPYLKVTELTPAQLDQLITNTEETQSQDMQELEQQQEDSSALDSAVDNYKPGQ